MDRDVPRLGSLSEDSEVHDAAPFPHVDDAEIGDLRAPQGVEEIGRQDGPIPPRLERAGVIEQIGRLEQGTGLGIGQGRRLPLVRALGRAFHAGHRVRLNGVLVAEVVKERAHGRELASDGRRRERSGGPIRSRRPGVLERGPPGDDMGPGDGPELFGVLDPAEGDKGLHIALVGPPGVLVVDVGEPDGGSGHIREVLELLRREHPLGAVLVHQLAPSSNRHKARGILSFPTAPIRHAAPVVDHEPSISYFTLDNVFYQE